ncbi:MAG: chromosomal replication initiator protein DnaA [Bacteroidota bacterium]|jgi:chromosomal replication initiator protein
MVDRKDFEGGQPEVLEDVREETGAREHEGPKEVSDINARGGRVRATLKARLGEDVYSSWFNSLEFQSFDGKVLKVSVPVKFLKTWIQTHYSDALLSCCALEFDGVERVEVIQRHPGGTSVRPAAAAAPQAGGSQDASVSRQSHSVGEARRPMMARLPMQPQPVGARLQVNGLEGSPLDPRYTFDSFMVGASNRMAHAGATQVAETVFADERGFNPLYIHSAVGHGKTHLLHAIAWEVRRRSPHAQVLYLTAERFRFQFVEALKSQDAMGFKDRFRSIDMLLIDDLEFMHGEKTELEFDHIINALLDGGRQLVVASARPPAQLARLNDRMRSRLARGLVTEMGAPDYDLRHKILERRLQEKRAVDASFNIPEEAIALLAERLTESGRELEGVVTRLYAIWQYMRTPITADIVETAIRDLVSGVEPRRIKIEDILRVISRHYGVSKGDILSQRRHRSVVWPRQIGMYLAKQLTQRSLPEIGRRFGNRDHTTVLHAIRKIEGELTGNTRLKDEIEDLKKQLSH